MDPYSLRLSGASNVFSAKFFRGGTAGSAPLRAQLQASRCCQLCPKQRSKALWASSSHEPCKDHRNRDRVLTLKTTSKRLEVSLTRPAPLLVHDVLPERDAGTRSVTSSLAHWTLIPYG